VAYDEELADRVRNLVSAHSDISEREMFGGIAFMVGGNMAVGVRDENLIVRLDREEGEKALAERGVREFDLTGRPMSGWILVQPEQTADDGSLAAWVEAGAGYAASLPPK
jgi:TfoX/Sxy family transcriptional regulator of competence genes